MSSYWTVSLLHFLGTEFDQQKLFSQAFEHFFAEGVEEFSIDEALVDEILGERSYSGGDLPIEVLDEVEEVLKSQSNNYKFYFSNELQAREFHGFVQSHFLAEVQLFEAATQDWNEEWKKHYKPIKISESLDVIPAWYLDENREPKTFIAINPGMGFGTGSHETTFLCLKLMLSFELPEKSCILDFGSGSGILGIGALKVFSRPFVDFYDIDLEANKNCFENIVLNKLEESSYRLLLPEYRSYFQKKYDLIFANILQPVLLEESRQLVDLLSQDGRLIMSGLLQPQVELVLKTYEELGLVHVQTLNLGDWSALMMKKDIV